MVFRDAALSYWANGIASHLFQLTAWVAPKPINLSNVLFFSFGGWRDSEGGKGWTTLISCVLYLYAFVFFTQNKIHLLSRVESDANRIFDFLVISASFSSSHKPIWLFIDIVIEHIEFCKKLPLRSSLVFLQELVATLIAKNLFFSQSLTQKLKLIGLTMYTNCSILLCLTMYINCSIHLCFFDDEFNTHTYTHKSKNMSHMKN